MGYQESMFSLEVMQDRSARMGHGSRIKLPVMNRGECSGAAVSRARGEQSCPFTNCRYHLWGEALRITDDERVAEMQVARWERERPHTCALDIADDGGAETDQEIANYMGIDRDKVPQRVAEAAFKMRDKMKAEFDNEAAFVGNKTNHDLTVGDDSITVPARATATGLEENDDTMSGAALGFGVEIGNGLY